jgi:ATP-binding protein involved in chromosome partitioning
MGQVQNLVSETLAALPGVSKVTVNIGSRIVAHKAQQGVTLLPNVKNIIAVASGKGGVGKSTTSVNLALALAAEGATVGLLDADIYGPSIPIMFDVADEKPKVRMVDGRQLMVPVESYGVKVLSIGFFADTTQAIVWRGPMASKALNQLFSDADWGDLDYLLIDLPPGTGDIQLTAVLYHSAAGSHKDAAAMAALSEVLASTPNGRLHQSLIEKKLAVNVNPWNFDLAERAMWSSWLS